MVFEFHSLSTTPIRKAESNLASLNSAHEVKRVRSTKRLSLAQILPSLYLRTQNDGRWANGVLAYDNNLSFDNELLTIMSVHIFEPKVNPAAEFLEISNDFTDPKEILREAISNSFDAKAKVIKISATVNKATGVDELVLQFEDEGEGMTNENLESFFGLGFSKRRELNGAGEKISKAIGEKGHGTKIYFNSRRIEVSTVNNGKRLEAAMDLPRQTLRRGEIPKVNVVESKSDKPNGTSVTVYGYNGNSQIGFSHAAIKDYIMWFTKFGSFEKEVGIKEFDNIVIHLSGLGHMGESDRISFGHIFPPVNVNLTDLKKQDKISPLDFYVARWVYKSVQVKGMPNSKIDIVFGLEGDQAKRTYNQMIHKHYASWNEGEYTVEQRYGLWLCKDFIPICRKNDWVSEKSEWTKYHAFVNSQDFHLTANRSNLDNTPVTVMKCIEDTVRSVFKEQISISPEYRKFQEELERQQQYKDALAEEKDFERRKKAALSQKTTEFEKFTLVEPRQEGGVFSLVMVLLAKRPELFGFKIVDYDTGFGYDLLVTKDTSLDLNRAALRFVEMKHELRRDFSHSFAKLAGVICWDTKLSNEDEITDLKGDKRVLKITAPKLEDPDSYTKYMLTSDTADINIEVFVLKDFLKERLGLDFKAQAKK